MSLTHQRFIGVWTITLFLSLVPHSPERQARKDQPTQVSILQLIASPAKEDGRVVSLIGFLQIDSEGARLYLHREDFDNGILSDSLAVDQTKEMLADSEKLDMRYVWIVAEFKAGDPEHRYGAVGELTNIQRCQVWSDPDNPRNRRSRK